ncbi:MAG: insulinase family protein [Candidatus Wallbacteria bacterium]|nr:insulinase family protein [Candidatus Wallbacteria bacterium]
MRIRHALLTLVLLSAPVLGANAPKVEAEKYTLGNGLQVLLHVDRKLPIVHVNEWFHVGSKNEKPGRTGFAHLFEHMMFQGSKNAQDKYLAYAEQVGASLRDGGVNGTTDTDRTNYFITAPSSALEKMLWLESDRITGLLDAMTQEKLDNQRDVVKNERRQSYENVPYGRWLLLAIENLYPAAHPYSWPTIGSMADLTAASMDDVKEFFRTYYTPNNLTLTVAGDFEPAEAKRLIEKYFAPIPPGPALDRPKRLPAPLSGERIVEARDRVPQARTYMLWHSPAFFDPGDADLDLAALVLSDGLSSQLQKLLVYEKQLCTSIQAFQMSLELSGVFCVIATARPGVELPEIERMITEKLHEAATNGVSAVELDRARNKHELEFIGGLERIGGFGGKADQLAKYNTYLGTPDLFGADLDRYAKSTPASVTAAIARWLDTPNRVLLRFLPEASGRETASKLDRTKAPVPGKDRLFQVPEVKTRKLTNGLTVFVVERPELPKVAVSLVSKGGLAAEAPDKAGVATLTLKTIDKGTKTRKALQIEEELAALGTELSRGGQREWMTLSVEVLERNLPAALDILADVAMHPTFPAEEVERERKKHLDDLLQEQQAPNRIARRVVPLLMFGAAHPYGHAVLGDESSIQSLKPEDLAACHAKLWRPGGSALVFSGDITLQKAQTLAEDIFGGWSGEAEEAAEMPKPQLAPAGKIYLVDRQDSAQTNLSLLLPGIRRDSPDYHALRTVDAVWGGTFGARLNMNLREKKGYSYGVFSYPGVLTQGGLWEATGGVQTKVTKESVAEFLKELKDLGGARPITQKELDEAKANRIRGYAQSFETLAKLNGKLGELFGQDRPLTDLADEPVEIEKITLAKANEVAQKYAVSGQLRLLAIGDARQIQEGLEGLGLGPVTKLDPRGNQAR